MTGLLTLLFHSLQGIGSIARAINSSEDSRGSREPVPRDTLPPASNAQTRTRQSVGQMSSDYPMSSTGSHMSNPVQSTGGHYRMSSPNAYTSSAHTTDGHNHMSSASNHMNYTGAYGPSAHTTGGHNHMSSASNHMNYTGSGAHTTGGHNHVSIPHGQPLRAGATEADINFQSQGFDQHDRRQQQPQGEMCVASL